MTQSLLHAAVDEKKLSVFVLLDLSKEFDSVYHNIYCAC